ncbi:hypothetical protein [Devosia sp.]|uniref:hypothetical protein n=1 Tax=Devosia sp. TaxID=1871048 RepID=UPI003A954324
MAEREVVVERSGPSALAIIGGIVVVLAIIAAIYFFMMNGNSGGSGTVDVDVPAVSVDVTPDGQ